MIYEENKRKNVFSIYLIVLLSFPCKQTEKLQHFKTALHINDSCRNVNFPLSHFRFSMIFLTTKQKIKSNKKRNYKKKKYRAKKELFLHFCSVLFALKDYRHKNPKYFFTVPLTFYIYTQKKKKKKRPRFVPVSPPRNRKNSHRRKNEGDPGGHVTQPLVSTLP